MRLENIKTKNSRFQAAFPDEFKMQIQIKECSRIVWGHSFWDWIVFLSIYLLYFCHIKLFL